MTIRVLVTRPIDDADELVAALRGLGLEPVVVPTIAIEPVPAAALDHAVADLDRYDWVVLTSANAGRALVDAMTRGGVRAPRVRWAAIGDATAEVVRRAGVPVAFHPSHADAITLAREVPIQPGERLLLPRGDLADDDLPGGLRARGGIVVELVAYRTVEGPALSRGLLRAAFAGGRPSAVLFASGSAVRGYLAIAAAEGIDGASLPAICSGARTAAVARGIGLEVLASSVTPDAATVAETAAAAIAVPLEMR